MKMDVTMMSAGCICWNLARALIFCCVGFTTSHLGGTPISRSTSTLRPSPSLSWDLVTSAPLCPPISITSSFFYLIIYIIHSNNFCKLEIINCKLNVFFFLSYLNLYVARDHSLLYPPKPNNLNSQIQRRPKRGLKPTATLLFLHY